MSQKNTRLFVAALAAATFGLSSVAHANEPINIGVSTFTSGPGAVFGVPAQKAAELLVDEINEQGGIKGHPLALTFIDENRGVDNVVVEYKRLAEAGDTDAMIIGLSSSICLAVAPVAEQLSMPTVFWDCGTARVYEENDYEYVYRTGDYTPSNNVAAALCLLKTHPEIKTVAGINQDYAFGRDNWAAFKEAVETLHPDVEVVAELFPKLGTSDFSTEISRLSALRPDVIFTTLWGGDMNTFVRQAGTRGVFRNSVLVTPNGEASLQQLGKSFPEGAIVGVRGDSYALDPAMADHEGHTQFVQKFKQETGAYPSFPSYHMAQAVTAIQKALEENWDGDRANLQKDLLAGLQSLELDNFTGQLFIREDNQAMEGQLMGTTRPSDEHDFMVLDAISVIPYELTTPPVGSKTHDWIPTLDAKIIEQVEIRDN